jgi:hypothetical protein
MLAAWLLAALSAQSLDDCPSYPAAARLAALDRRQSQDASQIYRQTHRFHGPLPPRPAANVNYIDDILFAAMERDAVPAAAASSDAEFLRRVTLDLTGRIPSLDEVIAFLADAAANKRAAAIDRLMASSAFTDYWTQYLLRRYQVTSAYYYFIGIPGRTAFYNYVRDRVGKRVSFDSIARDLLAAQGDSHAEGPPNWVMRAIQPTDPIQDTWDELTNRATSQFLGIQTQCISCHDGRRRLDKINVYLSKRTRADFWRLAAFFSRLNIQQIPLDTYSYYRKGILTDRSTGGYNGVLDDPNNPGPRPARSGAVYTPRYLFTGESPGAGHWRAEFARMLTADRQFARATVNYFWAHFFRAGIVDPPDTFDLDDMQASNPELLESLTTRFIESGFDWFGLIRHLVESRAYQLSSRPPPAWLPVHQRYFAKQSARRLRAEELFDAIAAATLTPPTMFAEGAPNPLRSAHQLPDPTEPRGDGSILEFLRLFGRGDWIASAPTTSSNTIQTLYLMNHDMLVSRTFGNIYFSGSSRVAQLLARGASDREAIREMILATLGREPGDSDYEHSLAAKRFPRELWLADLQWAYLNQLEFIFNH